jgi:hypothetical protein
MLFLVYFCVFYLVGECKQMAERWEDAVEEGKHHWKPRVKGDEKAYEKQAARLEETRLALKTVLDEKKPTLGSVLVGDLKFESTQTQAIVERIKRWGDCVVIRPYFYEAFNYFDIGLILCFTTTIVLHVVQLVQEMTALPNTCAGNAFVAGSFAIAETHTARIYLIAFGSFFCWCKVRKWYMFAGIVMWPLHIGARVCRYSQSNITLSNYMCLPNPFPRSTTSYCRCSSTSVSARASPPCSLSSGA